MQSLSVLISSRANADPASVRNDGGKEEVNVGREFARFLRANADPLSSIFVERVLTQNTKLEHDNRMLWRIVWKEYGPEQLRQAIMRFNMKGWGFQCTCLFCSKNASPMIFPQGLNRQCEIRYFIKMAIQRAGLSFSMAHIGPVESPPYQMVQRDGLGLFINAPSHLVFDDLDDVYSIMYGAGILNAVDRMDMIVFDKIQSLFRMLRERQHHTYMGPN